MAVLLYQGNLQFLAGYKKRSLAEPDFDFRGIHFCREAEFVYAGSVSDLPLIIAQ